MHKKTSLSLAVLSVLFAMSAQADVIGTGSTGTGTSNVFGTNSDAVTINGIAADGANIVGNDNTGGVGSTILGNNNNTNNDMFSPGNSTGGIGALSGGVAIGNNINTYAGGIGIGNFATAIGGIAICNGCTANTGEVNFGGGMRIIGVADAQLPNDVVNLGQVQGLLANQNLTPDGSFTVGATYEMPIYFNNLNNGTPEGADFQASGVTNGLNVNLGAHAGQIYEFDPNTGATLVLNSGFNNVNIGTSAGEYTTATTQNNGDSNVNIGFLTGLNTFGNQNTNVGNGSGGEQTGSGNSNYGSNAGGNANVNFTTNIGTDSFSQVDNGTAVGHQAVVTATATNSAAIAAFSVATEANTVSVGNDTLKRRITNVADPINDGDVVNFKTLKEWTFDGGNKAEIERLDNKINKLQKRSFGGTALAMAMAGAPPNDGHDASFSIGSAIFNDQGAIAASLQLKNVANGAVVGLGWGVTTARDVGVRATISWQWNPSASSGADALEGAK